MPTCQERNVMDKIGPIYLDCEQAKLLSEVLEKIAEEQEQIRNDATKKITSVFALQNLLKSPENKTD